MEKDIHRLEENIFKSYIQQTIMSRIYKEPLQFNKKKTTQFKNWEKIWVDILLKKVYKWPVSTWKDYQSH